MAVRDRVAQLIEASGLKQKSIADRLGEPEYWLSNRLIGRTVIRADELPRIAAALDVEPCELLRSSQSHHEARSSEQAPTYLDRDAITKAWAERALALSERDVGLLIDFLEFQRRRE